MASDRGVWAATVDGLLVHVDPKTNRVVGNPKKLLPDKSYPIFFTRGNALYLAAGDLIRLDSRTGRVLRRTRVRGKQPFIASLFVTGDSVWATVSEQFNFAESLVRYDPLTLRELLEVEAVRQWTVPWPSSTAASPSPSIRATGH